MNDLNDNSPEFLKASKLIELNHRIAEEFPTLSGESDGTLLPLYESIIDEETAEELEFELKVI